MPRVLFLLMLSGVACGIQSYKAFKTSKAYVFHMNGYGYRALINKKSLNIISPHFNRKWHLPDDSDISNAKTFRDGGLFTVVVPRFRNPELEGGEVPRGTTIRFASDHVCATFDGSEPLCGSTPSTKCEHGKLLKDFVVHDDEIILKLRTCKADIPSDTVIYHAYDPDVYVTEIINEDLPIYENGIHGWFDRHGIERNY